MGIVKNILYRLSGPSLLPLMRKQTIFPYYHLVRDEKVAHIENLYPYKNIAQFQHDLDFLTKHYRPATPRQILDGKVPDNSFLLTFDDGLSEIYSVIYPMLKQRNLSAVFFINPDFVDNQQSLYKHDTSVIISHLKAIDFDPEITSKIAEILGTESVSNTDLQNQLKNIKFSDREKVHDILKVLDIDIQKYLSQQKPYLTKAQIQEMLNDGFYFGGHTMSHPPLHQLSIEEQQNEIVDSMRWLKQNFGLNYSMFAFPFSDKSASRKLLDVLFAYDQNIRIFGNAGIKKDIDPRIIQRFSLENPRNAIEKQIVTENLYKLFNRLIGKYHIARK